MSEVKGISCKDAWALLQENPKAVLIDVRSSMEYLFVGHPKGAVNVPWIDEPEWVPDPHFDAHIRQVMLGGVACAVEGDCPPIILVCRSGRRSLDAGGLLIKKGMSGIYNVEHGFEGDLDNNHQRSTLNGWRFDGLPWEQS